MVKILFIILLVIHFDFAYCQQDSIQEMGWVFEDIPEYDGYIKLFIRQNIIYPETAIADSIEGKVYVSYIVDTLGFTTKHKIEKGIRDDLNEEAIRIIKMIKYKSPAKFRGKPISFYSTLPVEFKLPNENREQ
jgi:protein TonB